MIIIAGYILTQTGTRDAAVAAFADMVARARRHDGCLDLAISADPVDPARINLFECWRDQPSLNAWRKVAKGPHVNACKPTLACIEASSPKRHSETGAAAHGGG